MYVILLGLAVIDGLDGIPTISGAATQIRLLLNSHPRHLHLKLTPFQCMKHIHVWMFAFTDTAQCLMILMVRPLPILQRSGLQIDNFTVEASKCHWIGVKIVAFESSGLRERAIYS